MCIYCETETHYDEDGDIDYVGGEKFGNNDGYICGTRIVVYYDCGFGATGVSGIKYCPFCGRKIKE